MNAPESVILFSNGATAVFDKSGEQIGELQKSWFHIWLDWMESKGIDPTKIKTIETIQNGRYVYLHPIKVEGKWTSKNGHALDKAAIDSIMSEEEVMQWFKQMNDNAFLPQKRN